MTEGEAQTWRRAYNNLHNEGGEGYVPEVVTQEQFAAAHKILEK